jgi:hypothetical protein
MGSHESGDTWYVDGTNMLMMTWAEAHAESKYHLSCRHQTKTVAYQGVKFSVRNKSPRDCTALLLV